MGRTQDLQQVMDSRLLAAVYSPPVEIVIVNYNSRDGLDEYIQKLDMPDGVTLTYRHYSGREHWHMAHGFNLAALPSSGKYFWIMGCDLFLSMEAVAHVRELIERRNDPWLMARKFKGMIVCRKDLFVEAGGYDERFEFYGQEGEELNERLRRRGYRPGYFSNRVMRVLPTERDDKVKNYRIKAHMTDMSRLMRPIYEQCKRDQVMKANEGKEWGSWN
jgi:hypothetical protein